MTRSNKFIVALGLAAALAGSGGAALSQSQGAGLDDTATWYTTRFAQGDLHYASAGQPGRPLVIFIHGTPGSWRAFRAYLENPRLLEQAHMVALDRPGFGRSGSLGVHPSFSDQAAAVAGVFSANRSDKKAVVVGHSLGGSISYRVAIDYPDQVGAVMAISAAIDPALSNPRWYNHVARIPPIRWLLPGGLRTSNREMMPLADQLAAMTDGLPGLTMPVTVIQGATDNLVNHKNADYAEAKLTNAVLKVRRFADQGHFIVWEEHDAMVDEILQLIASVEPLPQTVVRQQEQNKNITIVGSK